MNRLERYLEKEKFLNGIVLGWADRKYGRDIGYSEVSGKNGESAFDAQEVEEIFRTCQKAGFNAGRMFLHEIMEGLLFDDEGVVIGVQPEFLRNLGEFCAIAQRMGFALVMTIQPHISYSIAPERYPFFTRHLFEPECTKVYLEKHSVQWQR